MYRFGNQSATFSGYTIYINAFFRALFSRIQFTRHKIFVIQHFGYSRILPNLDIHYFLLPSSPSIMKLPVFNKLTVRNYKSIYTHSAYASRQGLIIKGAHGVCAHTLRMAPKCIVSTF